ncbi:MAG: M24 family metallopeptidase [Anaerolineae bacterium]|nr:M24 family metallopeptidase [Anaerolineae bacterium]
MKSQLNSLMADRNLEAIVILASHDYSAPLDYLVGSVHITGGMAWKKRNADPILVVGGMEIEEARASGLTCYTYSDFGYYELLAQHHNDPLQANVALWGVILDRLGIRGGKIGIYGTNEIHQLLALVDLLRQTYPQFSFVGEAGTTLFDQASLTKSSDELDRIQSVAKRTNDVLEATWNFIAGHDVVNEVVMKGHNTPLTIGDVRTFVRRSLLERGLEDTGMIFAQGRDAGFPHSRGQDDMPLRLGQSIVFDLFPRELGGGYHHDVTRTWCIGYAPQEVHELYQQVMTAFDIAVEAYALNKQTYLMQTAVQDYFEKLGHPTLRSDANTQVGYTHSLGHGVGLKIHERPRIAHNSPDDVFSIGNVITIEPGLYYPDKGVGIRIEDSFYITETGELVSLTPFRKDLVLPMVRKS